MLRVAVVGLGMAAEPHARSLAELQDRIEVRWMATRSAARRDAFAERFAFPTTCDVEAAITDPDVDAVFLLTPPDTHFELAALALSHGKHLLIEKPLDASLSRAAEIVARARAARLQLGVVLQHRFRPAARRLRALMSEGALGRIQFASLAVPWWRPQAYYDEPGRGALARDGGGVLMTQAIHSLDLFRSLAGPFEVIAARASTTALHRMETEDHVAALLGLPGGGSATVMATTASYPGQPERIEIVGDRAAVVLSGGKLDVDFLDGRSEQLRGDSASGAGVRPMDFPHGAHRALIEDFHRAVANGGAPEASGEEALATQALIAEILAASGPVRKLGNPSLASNDTPLEDILCDPC